MQTDRFAQEDHRGAEDISRQLISADRVQGTPVYNEAGDKLGHIEDVMLHKQSGRVAYAIMSYGGFLGAGERYHPLPWSMLAYDTDKNGYVVALTKDQLSDAPTLGREQFNADDDSEWGEAVHSHYRLPGPFI
jgi:sporulation protein YlmC with PRC-barrel domain